MNKLLQISGGAVYTDEHETIKFDVTPRLKALMEVIEETDHKGSVVCALQTHNRIVGRVSYF